MTVRIEEDIELIKKVLIGNPQAQEILYNKYKEIVKNFLRSKYSSYNDIEDDVSEIMIKIFINLNTFDIEKSKFKSWVFTISNNHMIDKWRNSNVTLTGSNTNCVFSYSTIELNDNENLISNNTYQYNNKSNFSTTCAADYDFEINSSINFISNQLSAQDFTFLDMKYMLGYSYDEIGTEFNLTSSTVSNKVNYIKTKLKKNNSEIIYE